MNRTANVNSNDFGFPGFADWVLTLALTAAVAVAIVSGAGAIGGL